MDRWQVAIDLAGLCKSGSGRHRLIDARCPLSTRPTARFSNFSISMRASRTALLPATSNYQNGWSPSKDIVGFHIHPLLFISKPNADAINDADPRVSFTNNCNLACVADRWHTHACLLQDILTALAWPHMQQLVWRRNMQLEVGRCLIMSLSVGNPVSFNWDSWSGPRVR